MSPLQTFPQTKEPKSTHHPLHSLRWILRLIVLCLGSGLLAAAAETPAAAQPPLPARAAAEPFTLAWSSAERDSTTSLAWGDYDNDGDLDLAVGNGSESDIQPNRLYRNDGGTLTLAWSADEIDSTNSLAWGDYDSDGDLDLAVGNSEGQPNRLYRNDSGTFTLIWSADETDSTTRSLAWGDYDGDGDLDLAVGNYGYSRLYRNDGGVLILAWSDVELNWIQSVAWGDYDSDGDLDLAVGNDGYHQLYRNDGGTLILAWSSEERDSTTSVAWGDYDNDGDLDLAVGNDGYPNQLYRNDGGTLILAWSSEERDLTTSVAWGDYDNDGDLDLAVGNESDSYNPQPNRLYRNDGGTLILAWSSTETDNTTSVAWGDYDGDGDLDLAVGNTGYEPNRLYRNDGGTLNLAWWPAEMGSTTSVAWGDYDGDGDIDLVVGNHGPNNLYRNDGGTLTLAWSSNEIDNTTSLAWGDYDSDGDLDLAVGSCAQPNRLYRNEDRTLTLAWSSTKADCTQNVAWGDYDSDGDLDLAAGGSPNRLYRNDGGMLIPAWSSEEMGDTTSVAWGDYDGDGDLDLAVGNTGIWEGQPNRLYHNNNGMMTLAWSSTETDHTYSVAWGDYDGDGDLDLAVGNYGDPNRLYRNDSGTLNLDHTFSITDYTTSLAWGDYDGDGDSDLAVGNSSGNPNRLYRNDGGTLTLDWSSEEMDYTTSVAWGDYDGDGNLDLAVGNSWGNPNRLYRNDGGTLTLDWSSEQTNTTSLTWGDYDSDGDLDLATGDYYGPRLYRNDGGGRLSPASIPRVSLARPGLNADAFSDPQIWSGSIPISFNLTDPQSDAAAFVRAWYSLDGGGKWLPAVAASGTVTTNLASSPAGVQHIFHWDVNASGFFGQSDDVVLRLQALPGTANHPNGIPGPYLYGASASSTFPFRVRGTQIRVMREDGATSAAQATVYRLEDGFSGRAEIIAPAYAGGEPYRTNGAGYLLGRGELNLGDRLVALWPAVVTDTYTLYYTSAAPNATEVDFHTVTAGGVQTLTVSPANPLLLLNLDVSLQWDARYDPAYLQQLESDLKRASELLYDWTDGQAALGDIHLYQNREHWNDAHIRIYASNDLRPMALQGGIVSEVVTDTQVITITYGPGQVHLGAVWNRYGAAGGSLGEDWPRALAHELGHYALYLNDNYFGLSAGGVLQTVETCPGAMSDPYRGDAPYSEFHTAVGWSDYCDSTLSNQTTRRDDWSTIRLFYSLLQPQNNPGPAYLPLDVTRILQVTPASDPSPIADPTFYTIDEMQQRLIPSPAARAFLFQDGWAIDLGNVVQDHVLARGARPGDELCISDLPRQQAGCATIALNQEQLTLHPLDGWQPEVLATPVNSTTLQVAVSGVPLESLQVSLYPFNGPLTGTLSLSASGIITFHLAAPVWEGYLRLVDSASPNRQTIVDFAIGGNPSSIRGSSSSIRGSSSSIRGSSAPVMSADGQVILFTDETALGDDQFYVLQAAAAVPDPLLWATPVGKAYRLSASVSAPDLSQAAISFGYNPTDIPEGMENWLRLYYYPLDGGGWRELPTALDAYNNMASAPCQGQGWYALMAAVELSLSGPGWEAFSYPLAYTQSVSQALLSIDDAYTSVYWYNAADPADPWKLFDRRASAYANDLSELRFAEAYWIHLSQAVTLTLGGGEKRAPHSPGAFPWPPATFYGQALPGASFVPAAGMTVNAWVNGTLCGQALTELYAGQVVYDINVNADTPFSPGCGAEGRRIRFQVDGRWANAAPLWNNDRAWELPLAFDYRVFLPSIQR